MKRFLLSLFILFNASMLWAQNTSVPMEGKTALRSTAETSTRAIRRTMPLTNSIRRAMNLGTRDFTGRPGPNYWQISTDYSIDVRLLPSEQTLYGSETINVHNTSTLPMTEIVLRLDHNIFRADVPRGSSVPAETTAGMVVTRIKLDGAEVDLHPHPRGRLSLGPQRLAAFGLTQTVARISLLSPIEPGARFKLEIEWNTKLPGGPNGRGHRMTQRWDDRLFQPTQWYPRVAKFDDMGDWDDSVYLGPAEFNNNFGKFDVRIDVPSGWIVSGTGVLQNPEEVLTDTARKRLSTVTGTDEEVTIVGIDERGSGKGTAGGENLVWHFAADKVNDFAWAASDEFVWKAARAMIPKKGPIPIHMVFLPERADRFKDAGRITRHALEFYSGLWAPYPFPQLTLQDGPSAGMEYPMVINSNQGAADHETAHQWWPMMVGTNETQYGWMDEGFNQYMNILSDADAKGTQPRLNGLGQSYGRISGSESEAPMMWSANYAGSGYGFQTYAKTPLMLSMLGGIVGDANVQKAMSKYTEAWSFKHPSPWDFAFFMNHELGQDLEWFWYYWLWTTESVDGSIKTVSAKGGKTFVTVYEAGEMPSPVVLDVKFAPGGPAVKPMPNSVMTDKDTARVTWPVDVWFNGSRTFIAELNFGGRKIEKITFDPDGRFPDRQPIDNVWPLPAGYSAQ